MFPLFTFNFLFNVRYVAVEVKPEKSSKDFKKLSGKELSRQILGVVSRLHGEFGLAAVRHGFSGNFLIIRNNCEQDSN